MRNISYPYHHTQVNMHTHHRSHATASSILDRGTGFQAVRVTQSSHCFPCNIVQTDPWNLGASTVRQETACITFTVREARSRITARTAAPVYSPQDYLDAVVAIPVT
jgi:hypothetical protein